MEIKYQKTSFIHPEKINERTFLDLKKKLNENSNYVIENDYKSFYENYKTNFIYIIIGIIVIFIGDSLNLEFLKIIGGIAILPFIGELFLEGRSYATYIKERKEYFEKMAYSITTSKTYTEYLSEFYN